MMQPDKYSAGLMEYLPHTKPWSGGCFMPEGEAVCTMFCLYSVSFVQCSICTAFRLCGIHFMTGEVFAF